jgi:hypothetical protein
MRRNLDAPHGQSVRPSSKAQPRHAVITLIATIVLAMASLAAPAAATEPLIHGTVFLSPDIITESDPTAFEYATPAGTGTRNMFDRRVRDMVDTEAHLFDAVFSDGLCLEFVVNTELGAFEDAEALVEQYAPIIGRLPGYLRRDVTAVWMHPGDEVFAGGSDIILIHTGATAEYYIAEGVLEEVLAHEAAHTSLDLVLAQSQEWIDAQEADGAFISEYAAEHPEREDVAETVVPWIAICCGDDRVDADTATRIRELAGHRLAVLERVIGELSELPAHGGKAGCAYESPEGE